jgi:hypothetical protein
VHPIDLVSAFVEERGWIALRDKDKVHVSSGMAHVATITFEDLQVKCAAPGGNRPEWNINLYDPNSLPTLIAILKYLDDRCVYTLCFKEESDGQCMLELPNR